MVKKKIIFILNGQRKSSHIHFKDYLLVSSDSLVSNVSQVESVSAELTMNSSSLILASISSVMFTISGAVKIKIILRVQVNSILYTFVSIVYKFKQSSKMTG